jgi:hypothetical protein
VTQIESFGVADPRRLAQLERRMSAGACVTIVFSRERNTSAPRISWCGKGAHCPVQAGGRCPDHPDSRLREAWVDEQVSPGAVDWPAVQARLREHGIILLGGGARRRDAARDVADPDKD